MPTLNIQFRDETEAEIVAIFAVPQDESWKNQGAVEIYDARYRIFYEALPESLRIMWPRPGASAREIV
ncbi:hypothetical protein [Cupriavidus basilensis]